MAARLFVVSHPVRTSPSRAATTLRLVVSVGVLSTLPSDPGNTPLKTFRLVASVGAFPLAQLATCRYRGSFYPHAAPLEQLRLSVRLPRWLENRMSSSF
jgi:hypothetical protein